MSSKFQLYFSITVGIFLILSPIGMIDFIPATSWQNGETDSYSLIPNISVKIIDQFTIISNIDRDSNYSVSKSDSNVDFAFKDEFKGFLENQGQFADNEVQYYLDTNNLIIGFTDYGLKIIKTIEGEEFSFTIKFAKAKFNDPIPVDKRVNYDNYYFADLGLEKVPRYNEIFYYDIYPGIDIHYFFSNNGLKYEFYVAPQADPSQITFDISNNVRLDIKSDKISIRDMTGRLVYEDYNLFVYQEHATIQADFVNKGPNRYGFHIPLYNPREELVIDPLLLEFSTYIGGNGTEAVLDIGIDSSRNIYVIGYTDSVNFPILNAINSTINGNTDIFVSKFNSTGSLLFSTYIGGSNFDSPKRITVDGTHVYLTGETQSPDFPTLNAIDETLSGTKDAFLVELSTSGLLVVSSYLGGTGDDVGNDINTNSFGEIIIGGVTSSTDFPVLNAVLSTHQGGTNDGFLVKFNPDISLNFSTYMGGVDEDDLVALDLDAEDYIYFVLNTQSANLNTSSGAYQSTYGKKEDVYAAKYSSDGYVFQIGTYIGGNAPDIPSAIGVDSEGNMFIGGNTHSNTFPTLNPIQAGFGGGGGGDAFVVRFNSTAGLSFATLMGSTGGEQVYDIATDELGNVYVTGFTSSSGFPVITDALQSTIGGGDDAFITKFTTDGVISNSTFVGSSGDDIGYGILLDDSGYVYIAGSTTSTTFNTTSGAYQTANGGGTDGFITKYLNPIPPTLDISFANNSQIAPGAIITVDIGGNDTDTVWFNWDSSTNQTLFPPYEITVPDDPGSHILNIYANDTYQQITYFVISLVVIGPNLKLYSPTTNSTSIEAGEVITLNITGFSFVLDTIIWNWNSGFNTSYNTGGVSDILYNVTAPSSVGQHKLFFFVNDSSAVSTQYYYVFTISGPLEIILNSISDGAVLKSGYNIDFNVSGDNIDTVWYNIDDGTNLTLNSPYDVTLSGVDGIYSINLYINDTAGSSNSTSFTFTLDSTNPSVTLNSPTNNTIIQNSVVIDYLITDAHLTDTFYSIDSGSNTTFSSPFDITLVASDGTHDISVYSNDSAGNFVLNFFVFTIDTQAPGVTITSPTAITYGTNSVTMTYSVSDGTVLLYQDDIVNSTAIASGSSWTSLTHGVHNLTITSVDTVGNLGITTVIFTIDIQAPVVTISSPIAITYGINSVTMTYSVSDGIVLLYQDDTVNSTAIPSGSSWTSLSHGTHNLTITSVDEIGNLGKITVIFSVDLQTPVIIITSPSAIIYGTNSVIISYSVSDGTVLLSRTQLIQQTLPQVVLGAH